MAMMTMKRVAAMLVLAMVAGMCLAAVPPAVGRDPVVAPGALPGAGATAAAGDRRALRRTPIVTVFESCKDAVVNISATKTVQVSGPFAELFDLPRRQFTATSLGSGFVIHASGYIVTNAHVVAQSTQWHVIFADKHELAARIVALDQEDDLAVLKVDAPTALATLKLGHSDDLMGGETVIAIGNPLGYQNTCTAGIVSALDRSITPQPGLTFHGLIQTDASINPGNSGGALLNVLGELIGINTAIRGDAQNIGFAIPVDHLRDLLPQMLDVERRNRIVTGLKLGHGGPARIESVAAGSPAAAAGLNVGDQIAAVNGQVVDSDIDFWIAMLGCNGGDKVALRVERGGQARDVTMMVVAAAKPDGAKLLKQMLGIEAQVLEPRMAGAMGMEGVTGLLVDKVETGGPARAVGVRRGDVVVGLGGHEVGNMDELGEVLERAHSGQRMAITYQRVRGNIMMRYSTPIELR
jgi:serine protease Do